MKCLTILIIGLSCLAGCSVNNLSLQMASTAVSQNIYINDANGEIGKALLVTTISISLLSSSGYIYSINWLGNITPSPIYYSGSNANGTAFGCAYSQLNNCFSNYGKVLYYGALSNKIYINKSIDANGIANYTNGVTILSTDLLGAIINYSPTTFTNQFAIELQESSKTALGIPETITPPLSIIFK